MHIHLSAMRRDARELLTGSSLRSSDGEETRKPMVEIARFRRAQQVPDALLALLPERECLLDGTLTSLREQDDLGTRVGRISRHPDEARLLQGQYVARQRGPVHPQGLRHLAHAGTAVPESGDGDEHAELRDLQAGAAQVLVIEPGHGARCLPHTDAGALRRDFPGSILEIGFHLILASTRSCRAAQGKSFTASSTAWRPAR